jgi:hypothetical protein
VSPGRGTLDDSADRSPCREGRQQVREERPDGVRTPGFGDELEQQAQRGGVFSGARILVVVQPQHGARHLGLDEVPIAGEHVAGDLLADDRLLEVIYGEDQLDRGREDREQLGRNVERLRQPPGEGPAVGP